MQSKFLMITYFPTAEFVRQRDKWSDVHSSGRQGASPRRYVCLWAPTWLGLAWRQCPARMDQKWRYGRASTPEDLRLSWQRMLDLTTVKNDNYFCCWMCTYMCMQTDWVCMMAPVLTSRVGSLKIRGTQGLHSECLGIYLGLLKIKDGCHYCLQAFNSKKKPVTTIRIAGYEVQTDVSNHYANSMRHLAAGIGNF